MLILALEINKNRFDSCDSFYRICTQLYVRYEMGHKSLLQRVKINNSFEFVLNHFLRGVLTTGSNVAMFHLSKSFVSICKHATNICFIFCKQNLLIQSRLSYRMFRPTKNNLGGKPLYYQRLTA